MMFPDDKRGQAWLTAFVAVPFSVLWPMSDLLTEEPGMRVLHGGVFGLLGAAIGLALYAFFGQRPAWVRVALLAAVFLIGLIVAWSFGR
jgi:MFS-type transporter involved in bile tolerance (Atg22 family)